MSSANDPFDQVMGAVQSLIDQYGQLINTQHRCEDIAIDRTEFRYSPGSAVMEFVVLLRDGRIIKASLLRSCVSFTAKGEISFADALVKALDAAHAHGIKNAAIAESLDKGGLH